MTKNQRSPSKPSIAYPDLSPFMKKIERLAIVINANKSGALHLAEELSSLAEASGTQTCRTTSYPVDHGFLKDADACCVLGGDGTLLSVAAESLRWNTPVFGVNQGKLGFLAAFSATSILRDLPDLLNGNYRIVSRSVIDCKTGNGWESAALNDAVIKSVCVNRMMGLRVFADGDLVTDYWCDGLIFSTPTGSTAYNLSAGGPIITPGAGVIVMTPICQHTLTNRALVFGQQTDIQVECLSCEGLPHLSIDGQHQYESADLFPFSLKIRRKALPLLQPLEYNYFEILRSKLKWGSENGV